MMEWLKMGGHGFYIWWSYGVFALAIAIEVWLLSRRRAQAWQMVRQAAEEDNA
jgi:heme exporter protein CcmD